MEEREIWRKDCRTKREQVDGGETQFSGFFGVKERFLGIFH